MDISRVSTGRSPPVGFHALIEIPVGVVLKHEFDEVLFYPGNHRFIPHTLSEDGDPYGVPVVGQAQ